MISNLFDRMKLPFRKDRTFLKALYDILGFYPHNLEIYRIAFSHKSLTYKPGDRRQRNAANATDDPRRRFDRRRQGRPSPEEPCKPLNNERLEFLGDAVLETVVSDIVFHHFDRKREGFLTATRSKIVSRESLNRVAADIHLERLIQAAHGTTMPGTNIGGNAFEALMGAIYLDRGFKHCYWFIANRIIGHFIDLETTAQKEVNFKSKLLEWCQKNRINQTFRMEGSEDDKKFCAIVVIEEQVAGRAEGRNKKEAQQLAAKEALTKLRREPQFADRIFRAKEKRTAMEADESFALPKIDEIEAQIAADSNHAKGAARRKDAKALPVLEGKAPHLDDYEAAYDAAYSDDAANLETIEAPAADQKAEAAERRNARRRGRRNKDIELPDAGDIDEIDFSESCLEFPNRPITDNDAPLQPNAAEDKPVREKRERKPRKKREKDATAEVASAEEAPAEAAPAEEVRAEEVSIVEQEETIVIRDAQEAAQEAAPAAAPAAPTPAIDDATEPRVSERIEKFARREEAAEPTEAERPRPVRRKPSQQANEATTDEEAISAAASEPVPAVQNLTQPDFISIALRAVDEEPFSMEEQKQRTRRKPKVAREAAPAPAEEAPVAKKPAEEAAEAPAETAAETPAHAETTQEETPATDAPRPAKRSRRRGHARPNPNKQGAAE